MVGVSWNSRFVETLEPTIVGGCSIFKKTPVN
jgi:hypothetical protein